MIETDYFILNGEQYQEFYMEALKLNTSIDYFLLEFCDVTGPMVECD